MTEDKKITLRKQIIDHYRQLASMVDERPLLIEQLESFARKIGYEQAHAERLLAKGLHYEMLDIVNSQRKNAVDRVVTYSTLAIQKDVVAAQENGMQIECGDEVRKDPLTCRKVQLVQLLDDAIRDLTGDYKRVAYLAACYFKRYAKQYALPFEIPVAIQIEMMTQVEDDYRKLKG